ncbi:MULTISPECIES: hypothetical protein [unclassified Bradyrhizobium]|uniref:hypothetical protein n=1 Tax=unclassified Bradyrhizobium TaxID=2631580 RepID=UPI0029169776|nr:MULTISPECIES: hypothetical protein [unclassified Bradyrhizobium]
MEILLPELLRQDPVKVQLEATLGKLTRLLSIRRPGTQDGEAEIALELRRLRDGIEKDGFAADRSRALKRLADWASGGEECKKKLRVEHLLAGDVIGRTEAECSRRGLASPYSEPQFSKEDEAAIDRYFGSSP